jgi:hypothetical protein
MDLLNGFEHKVFASWAASVPEQCERNLKLSLLTRNGISNQLALNFHPEVNCFFTQYEFNSYSALYNKELNVFVFNSC